MGVARGSRICANDWSISNLYDVIILVINGNKIVSSFVVPKFGEIVKG